MWRTLSGIGPAARTVGVRLWTGPETASLCMAMALRRRDAMSRVAASAAGTTAS